MRKLFIMVLILLLAATSYAAMKNWNTIKSLTQPFIKNQFNSNADLHNAEHLYEEGDLEGALQILAENEEALEYSTDDGKKWVHLLINISNASHNVPQLINLYESFPEAFDSDELLSLHVADAFIVSNRPKNYELLREKWKGKEGRPQDWLILDADLLILNNQHQEAIALLNSRTFEGPDDTGRLVRLALLHVPDQSKAAWDYLTTAIVKDPKNPDLHSFRARLLESINKPSLALAEYLAAVQTVPENIFLKDQLADFYLRRNEYPQAMAVWLETLKETPYGSILIKALFWNHVISPIQYDWSSISIPKGNLHPYITYLMALPQDQFWNESNFNAIPNGQRFLTTKQSSFWLRLLEDLKNGKEKDAYDLMQFNPFSQSSWNSQLEKALRIILSFRKNGTFAAGDDLNPLDNTSTNSQSKAAAANEGNFFLTQLEQLASKRNEKEQPSFPEELRALLLSKEVFSAAFLSAGWYEAALQLNKEEVLPSELPEWVSIGMTQAYKTNRGVEEALAFAAKQKPSKSLFLLIGELLAASKQPDNAIEKLQQLASEPSDIGMRAAWLLSLIYIEKGQYQQAEKTIDAQPRLANDILGKETKARIALLKGDEALATQLYSEIQSGSAEAKSFLARKAFATKDWQKAKELTIELLSLYPDNVLLHDNLKKINEEQALESQKESTPQTLEQQNAKATPGK